MTHLIPKSLTGPVVVERHDDEDGSISYEVTDHGSTYHVICHVPDHLNDHAKEEADFIALALNNTIGALMTIEKGET